METDFITVNVVVGDRNYRLKIEPKDEEKLRKSLKIINEKIVEFKTHFAGKDMQDFVAMTLVWLAMQEPSDVSSNDLWQTADVAEQLQKINYLFNKLIAANE
jgi:cell division protein ZapA